MCGFCIRFVLQSVSDADKSNPPTGVIPVGGNWRGGRDSNSRRNCFLSGLANRRTRPTMRPPRVRLTDGKWRRERDSNPRAVRPLVFKTSAIDHSAISPGGVHAWPVLQPTTHIGRRDRNRTCNLRIWRPLLCLIELPAFTPWSSIQEKTGYCKHDNSKFIIIEMHISLFF